jgi:hypothetical protein
MNNTLIYLPKGVRNGTIFPMFPQLFNKRVINPVHARIHHGTLAILLRIDILLQAKAAAVYECFSLYKYRKNHGSHTKIILDYSLEGLCYNTHTEVRVLMSIFNEYDVDVANDIVFVHNDIFNRISISDTIGQNITVDYHSIEAYSKCILTTNNFIDSTLVKDKIMLGQKWVRKKLPYPLYYRATSEALILLYPSNFILKN